ncbi:hypothetical protein OROGR_032783 [Orobanche gracilis]
MRVKDGGLDERKSEGREGSGASCEEKGFLYPSFGKTQLHPKFSSLSNRPKIIRIHGPRITESSI